MTDKQAYVSPPTGLLELTVIRDAQPRVLVNLDLGIPNFTVFSLKVPLVEDQPKAMSGLIAEAVHVLLDEVASFMMSLEYEDQVIAALYATVLMAFKGMSSEADTSEEQDKIGADPTVKTFEGTFNLPMAFVNETQKKVVTAAVTETTNRYKELVRMREKFKKFRFSKERNQLEVAWDTDRNKETGRALLNYELPIIQNLMSGLTFLESDPLFEEELDDTARILESYDFAKRSLAACEDGAKRGLEDIAPMLLSTVVGTLPVIIDRLIRLEEPENVAAANALRETAATKIKRAPKIRQIELSYDPAPKTTVNDAARVIRQYRNRSLKQQPKPLYVIVYDQMGRPTGTLSLGPKFKNQLLSLTHKNAAVDFSSPISFPNEQAMKSELIKGIPKAVSVGGVTYIPEGVAGTDMALYRGPQDWLVKFPDGRSQIFPGRPTFHKMRRLNFPVPRNRFKWTLLPPEEPSIKSEEAQDAISS